MLGQGRFAIAIPTNQRHRLHAFEDQADLLHGTATVRIGMLQVFDGDPHHISSLDDMFFIYGQFSEIEASNPKVSAQLDVIGQIDSPFRRATVLPSRIAIINHDENNAMGVVLLDYANLFATQRFQLSRAFVKHQDVGHHDGVGAKTTRWT